MKRRPCAPSRSGERHRFSRLWQRESQLHAVRFLTLATRLPRAGWTIDRRLRTLAVLFATVTLRPSDGVEGRNLRVETTHVLAPIYSGVANKLPSSEHFRTRSQHAGKLVATRSVS